MQNWYKTAFRFIFIENNVKIYFLSSFSIKMS